MEELQIVAVARQNAAANPIFAGLLPAFLEALLKALIPQIPTLFSCLGPTPTPAAVSENVAAAHDDSADSYVGYVLTPLAHSARVTARKQGNAITVRQSRALAGHALDAVRTAPPENVSAMLSAAGF